jgi:succinate dehydrogenase / fumarate reductase cytochrome b subunit
MTGIGLFIGLVFLTWWLLYITYYPNEIEGVVGTFFATKLGGIFLILWSYALFYHFCNGIRHLIWDFGYGFSIKQMNCTGWLVVFSSILMTMISWVIALRVGE